MYFSGPQQNIDKQVEELRETVSYHRSWANRLNWLGWGCFGGSLAAQITRPEEDHLWLLLLLGVAICWAWRYYEDNKKQMAREELWEYCRESVQKLHKWEGKGDDHTEAE